MAIPSDNITTSSIPTPNEEYLPPPGMPTEEPVIEEPKKDEKLKWDYSKILQGGTLGSLSANLHHGIAVGTDWNGWELNKEEQEQYDKILTTLLEPLMQKIEYLPLVIGILSLVAMEGMKVGNYFKYNKERKQKEEPKKPETLVTQTVPSVTRPGTSIPVQTFTAPVAPTGAVNFATGQNLDAMLPPVGRGDRIPQDDLPPVSPQQASTLKPPNT